MLILLTKTNQMSNIYGNILLKSRLRYLKTMVSLISTLHFRNIFHKPYVFKYYTVIFVDCYGFFTQKLWLQLNFCFR